MTFTKAIVRKPSESMIHGLSSSDLGVPDFDKAREQHQKYVAALQECGLEVAVLDALPEFPDSVFVEDVALLTPHCAIITRPGAPSRAGETKYITRAIEGFYDNIEYIKSPASLEAGDVMMAGSHYFIGLSDRTNKEGADQLIRILNKYGLSGSKVSLKDMLHLKSGISYLENETLLACDLFINTPGFRGMNVIRVTDEEIYAANSVWINGKVLTPEGYPHTLKAITEAGYKTIVLDMSEFRKLDGGLSCLSLRF